MAPSLRTRLQALLLGVALAALVLGGWVYWMDSYVHGTQSCIRCGARRSFDQRGPFSSTTEPVPYTERELCNEHAWERVGCWHEGMSFVRYASPSVH